MSKIQAARDRRPEERGAGAGAPLGGARAGALRRRVAPSVADERLFIAYNDELSRQILDKFNNSIYSNFSQFSDDNNKT